VEGYSRTPTGFQNTDDHGLEISHHVFGIVPRNGQALRPQPSIASFIAFGGIAHAVAVAVNFHDKVRGGTVEVHGAARKRMLEAEFPALRPAAQNLP
jgi:hypothetical protein